MYEDDFNELADKLAGTLKSPKDLSAMTRMPANGAMERVLEIEMEEHPGEKKNGRRPAGNTSKKCMMSRFPMI